MRRIPLSREMFGEREFKSDYKSMKKFGPSGVTENAVFLNSFYLDRRYYVPFSAIDRIYKRIAMSKGGFTGKGMFASLSYLVCEYDGGKVKSSIFKHEEDVDRMLAHIRSTHPEIKTLSKAGEERLERIRREEAKRYKKHLSTQAEEAVERLSRDKELLEKNLILSQNLSIASKRKRASDTSKLSLKMLAFLITLLGLSSALYGVYSLLKGVEGNGIYFVLFGLAAIFLFSGASIIPTGRNNKRRILYELEEARRQVGEYLEENGGISLPVKYAHPATIERTIRVIREGKAESIEDAFKIMKEELKALDSSKKVYPEELEEIIAIKPMFLIEDYKD